MPQSPKAVILVVDDEEAIQDLTSIILESHGYEVLRASNGAEAVELLERTRPDLVLLDILMPVLDGWGAMEHIRTMSDPPRVVIATGMHEVVPPGHVSHFIAGYLIKPFAVDQLIHNVEAALGMPAVVPARGTRREDRRTFVAEALLISDSGQPLAKGNVVELSEHGFRIDLALPFHLGDLVRIGFLLPGRKDPVRLTGRVRWRNEVTLGAEIEDPDPGDQELLRKILKG